MPINADLYMHELDRSALQALRAIPGFTPLLRAYMKVMNEQQMRLVNLSTNLRVSETQLPHYHRMLQPICEKLGIPVPELYLTQDPVPNAFTSGDNDPYIVLSTGLLEALPDELLPTVLAHECGHIACRHLLYHNMGRMILNGTVNFLGLGELISLPIQMAFFHWMRCSEYSADRAAAICDGGAEKTIAVCMHLAGFDKDICTAANPDAFLKQAEEYRQLVGGSKWNKTLEFLLFNSNTHPLNAVRALECREWCEEETFTRIDHFLKKDHSNDANLYIPLTQDLKSFVGENYQTVCAVFQKMGFENIQALQHIRPGKKSQHERVSGVAINGMTDLKAGDWCPADAAVEVVYRIFE